MKRGEKLPQKKRAELWAELLIDNKTGAQLAEDYGVSETSIINNRRAMREFIGEGSITKISKLMEIMERDLLRDMMKVRDICDRNLDTAVDDPETYDLQLALRDMMASCDSRARIFQRVALYVDASTNISNVNVEVVQAQAKQEVMKELLRTRGDDGKPLLSKQSKTRVLAHFAKPVMKGGTKS